jgi:predicted GNAT family acetyltransferase
MLRRHPDDAMIPQSNPLEAGDVRHNPAQRRFEMETPAGTAFANYHKDGDVLIVTHTETPRAVRGRGYGDLLVKGMLDIARAEGRKVKPLCSFVAAYMRRHPETEDLAG